MIKKTVTYKNFNDVEVTEDCYFNYTEAQLADLEMSVGGGLSATLKSIAAANNETELYKFFRQLILGAYGIKSPDGRKFMKSKEISEDFEQTAAYNTIFMELVQNTDAAVEFVNQLIPESLKEKMSKVK